ncbi:MAG: hypothetical protein LBT21_07175 [Oscillospiraceae bacterium]|jgi:hypothetical protein|nr:hypothetical protein [Oscillospiraceae bacterium]
MASLIDLIAKTASASQLRKSGEGRERPKNWQKSPVIFSFSQPVNLDPMFTALQQYCVQQKLTMSADSLNTGARFQKIVMGFSRWECAVVFNNDAHTELIFQVLSWYDNAGNDIPIYKLISCIERTILGVYPDAIVVENNEQKRLGDLYRAGR